MYLKRVINLLLIACLCIGSVSAQVVIKGQVVEQDSRNPIPFASVTISGSEKKSAETDQKGNFLIKDVKEGDYRIIIAMRGYVPLNFERQVTRSGLELGVLEMRSTTDAIQNSLAEMAVSDLELDNDMEVQEVSGLLSSSKDVYANIASYTFSPMRFKMRGYDSEYSDTYLNGVQMNDMISGYGVWSLWGGLNDATRNQESTVGIETGNYSFGNIGGVVNIDTRASNYRPGIKVSYSNSNRTYSNRVMATYSTGLMNNGWAFTASMSRRWGDHGYVEGVFYDAWAGFIAAEKKFNHRHTLAFTALASPTERGVASGATQEAYDLTGNNYYNPNIGYQNGKLRNARVRDNFEPVFVLNHYWNINDKNKLTTSAGFRFGKNGYSALNWYDAPDPRPDYYRNLPSYYSKMTTPPNLAAAEQITALWKNGNARYIDFDRLYNVNYNSQDVIKDADGNVVAQGTRSKYIIEDRRTDQKQFNLNMLLNSEINKNISINGGLQFRWNKTANFKTIKDLMGGDFWYDIDQFAERDFKNDIDKIQSDLNNPYRVVRKGDKYGYDYDANILNGSVWGMANFSYQKIDFYAGADVGYTSFFRDGKYRKGLFPDDSYGKSKSHNFLNYGLKGGFTYKINGRHYITGNVAYMQRAPYFRDAYISPRTRDAVINGLKEGQVFSVDGSYIVRTPVVKARITGFYTYMNNQTKTMSFYDDYYRSFGNYIMTGIAQSHAGVEVGVEYKILPVLTAQGAFSYGNYQYQSNPIYLQTIDNTGDILGEGKVYWKGGKVSGTPQTAASIGLTYNAPKYWWIGVNGNYFGRSYIDMNPILRTEQVRTDLGEETIRQEEFADGLTMDLFAGVSFRIAYKYFLSINLSVSNVLNNKELKSGGFEQLRVSTDKESNKYARPFDPKYFYMYGANYFANVTFRF